MLPKSCRDKQPNEACYFEYEWDNELLNNTFTCQYLYSSHTLEMSRWGSWSLAPALRSNLRSHKNFTWMGLTQIMQRCHKVWIWRREPDMVKLGRENKTAGSHIEHYSILSLLRPGSTSKLVQHHVYAYAIQQDV